MWYACIFLDVVRQTPLTPSLTHRMATSFQPLDDNYMMMASPIKFKKGEMLAFASAMPIFSAFVRTNRVVCVDYIMRKWYYIRRQIDTFALEHVKTTPNTERTLSLSTQYDVIIYHPLADIIIVSCLRRTLPAPLKLGAVLSGAFDAWPIDTAEFLYSADINGMVFMWRYDFVSYHFTPARTNDEAVEANTNPLHSVCHTHTKNWRETVDTALFSITHSTTDGSFIRWWSLHADWVPIIYYSSEIQCDKWHITHSWAGLPILSNGHVTLVVVRTVCTLHSCSLHKTKYENQLNRPDAARISFSSTHMKNLANE